MWRKLSGPVILCLLFLGLTATILVGNQTQHPQQRVDIEPPVTTQPADEDDDGAAAPLCQELEPCVGVPLRSIAESVAQISQSIADSGGPPLCQDLQPCIGAPLTSLATSLQDLVSAQEAQATPGTYKNRADTCQQDTYQTIYDNKNGKEKGVFFTPNNAMRVSASCTWVSPMTPTLRRTGMTSSSLRATTLGPASPFLQEST